MKDENSLGLVEEHEAHVAAGLCPKAVGLATCKNKGEIRVWRMARANRLEVGVCAEHLKSYTENGWKEVKQ
jgi:hypothetical protein